MCKCVSGWIGDWCQYDVEVGQGQGHKIKGQGQISNFVKNCFDYISQTIFWILMMLKHKIDINGMLKLTQTQGQL